MALTRRTAVAYGLLLAAMLAVLLIVVNVANLPQSRLAIVRPDDSLPPTLEQRLLIRATVKLERLEQEMTEIRKAPPTRRTITAKVTRPRIAVRIAPKPQGGLWSAEKVRTRAAFNKWADEYLKRRADERLKASSAR